MLIVVWDSGGKALSVLGFCSHIRWLQAQTGPYWKEVSPLLHKEEGRSCLWSETLYLLDSRLSVSRQISRTLNLQTVLLRFSYN